VVEEFIYSRTPIIQVNWDIEPSRYAELQIIGTFFEEATLASLKWGKKFLQKVV